MIIVAPFVGLSVVEVAQEMNREEPRGFAGINRFHLLWLWIAAGWYALGLLTPVFQFFVYRGGIISLLLNFVPAAAFAIPGYYGLALLAGRRGEGLHPVGRNLVGVLIIIFGFAVGAVIQMAWYDGLHSAWTFVFG
jgi:hypothetical protein